MAIKKELVKTRADGVKLYRTYSDSSLKIKQNETGIVLTDAVDVETAAWTYTETNERIENRHEQSKVQSNDASGV